MSESEPADVSAMARSRFFRSLDRLTVIFLALRNKKRERKNIVLKSLNVNGWWYAGNNRC